MFDDRSRRVGTALWLMKTANQRVNDSLEDVDKLIAVFGLDSKSSDNILVSCNITFKTSLSDNETRQVEPEACIEFKQAENFTP